VSLDLSPKFVWVCGVVLVLGCLIRFMLQSQVAMGNWRTHVGLLHLQFRLAWWRRICLFDVLLMGEDKEPKSSAWAEVLADKTHNMQVKQVNK
jgi:hypothetical protein